MNTFTRNEGVRHPARRKTSIAATALAALGISFSCATCAAADDDFPVQVPDFQHPRLLSTQNVSATPEAQIASVAVPAPAVPPTQPAATTIDVHTNEATPAAPVAPSGAPANAVPAVAFDDHVVPVAPAEAPAAVPVELPPERAALELIGGDGKMTNGYGYARAFSLRGMAVTSAGVLQGELTQQSRFGFSGNYGNVSLTHDFSEDYYTNVGVGIGNSPLFPSWRVDATGYRKFGSERQYVAGVGAYYAKGNEIERSDQGLLFTGLAYFSGMVIEGGVRLNWANPGDILGPSEYVAATFGNDDHRAIIIRYEHAKETYKVLPGGPELVNFKSNTINVQLRQRVSRDSMLLAGLEYYLSPVYDRLSLNLGWRWSLR
ncbi:hypothetical protein CAter282_3692 [Collimonas arenae]|uniref:YaiO beta-barrel domain-containing protein n=1 Tax=Collimonas arenae TaxID=279058 RepID=A0A127QNK0_9BURK|nr:YaiO family outer membrane beta-barrel protein [Collimonas arenae]AMP01473.1 hypothetical protein CAter10_4036 [Collimonas arenae]AMP11375.1 hypothetical protein CAter282_3692 [Collimonas arenae]